MMLYLPHWLRRDTLENVYRHQWRVGDFVCWDNRTTMHLALDEFDPSERRRMLRATIQGEESGFFVQQVA